MGPDPAGLPRRSVVLADMKIFYGNGVTRIGEDRKEIREPCAKYTIRDGVVFDSQALLRDVREMVAKSKQVRGTPKGQ